MKRTLALVLCLAMMFSCMMVLTACDKGGKQMQEEQKPATIVGDWEGNINFGGMIEEMMLDAGDDMPEEVRDAIDFSKLKITMMISFDENGGYKTTVDEDSVNEMVDALLEMLSKAMKVVVEEMLEAQGVTLDEYMSQMGMTWDELMEEAFPREDLIDEMNISDMSETGKYKIDGNKIYFDDEEEEYTEFVLTSEKLSFTKVVSEELEDEDAQEILESLLPLEFTRKN